MRVNFSKVIIHNFLSYGDAEVNLNDKAYCLVTGINNDKRDDSLSNGSGKSTWSSALCWALTGETIQGKKNNLKNIFIDEDSCYVTVLFNVDGTNFKVTRYKEPKSDLKIYINDEDKSGKGIKESEAILAQYLPDLTPELLASVIILGQGLPLKFSSNTPSGRKEVLEKLSKSDFMIQDIKNRLAKVISDNNSDLRKVDDALLAISTKEELYSGQKVIIQTQLTELEKPVDYANEISKLEQDIKNLNDIVNNHNKLIAEYEINYSTLGQNLNDLNKNKLTELNNLKTQFTSEVETPYISNKNNISTEKLNQVNSLTTEFNANATELKTEFEKVKAELNTKIELTQGEITRLKNIKDICPTCGQKLPGIVKPDTSKLELDLLNMTKSLSQFKSNYNDSILKVQKDYSENKALLEEKYTNILSKLETEYNAHLTNYNTYVTQIEDSFEKDISDCNFKIKELKDKLTLYKEDLRVKTNDITEKDKNLNKLKLEFENHINKLKELNESLLSIDNNLKKLEEDKLYNNTERDRISDQLAIDKKIETLIKRDFRGFLLSNIIRFIDSKCKEYALDIFGTDSLNFELDGNNIEISYLGKSFENLSGGEKQKVDLIIQFAIRDMMSTYLDFSCNIFILDEIFDNLDSLGCNKVLNLIANHLNDIESMFIISHHADELEIPYDTEMVVVKDINGISRIK